MYNLDVTSDDGRDLGHIECWFPKLIFYSDNVLNTEYLQKLTDLSKKIILTCSHRTDAFNVDSSNKTYNLLEIDEYQELVVQLLIRAQSFIKILGYSDDVRCKILNLWVNKSSKGDFLFLHVHRNSELSGVFYLETPDESTITFYNDMFETLSEPNNPSYFGANTVKFPCKKNSMLLFKSNLVHGNEYQPDGMKIVVAFNLIFEQK